MIGPAPSYHGYRFPPEIISHAVWLYHRFSLSFRDVEDLLVQRGIAVSYETIRQWCGTFGPEYARTLRRRRGRLGDTWSAPRRMVTDKLRSYAAAHRTAMRSVMHSTQRYENNRAEVSHQPTRRREDQMRRFTSVGQAQRFLSVQGLVLNLFRVGRHLLRAVHHRLLRTRAFSEWEAVTCAC